MSWLVTRPVQREWTHYMDGKSDKLVQHPQTTSSQFLSLSLQISAGVRHCLALDTPPPARGDVMFAVPLSVPARYPALRDLPCKAIHARLMLLNHFAKLMVASWKLFSIQNIKVILPLWSLRVLCFSPWALLINTKTVAMVLGTLGQKQGNLSGVLLICLLFTCLALINMRYVVTPVWHTLLDVMMTHTLDVLLCAGWIHEIQHQPTAGLQHQSPDFSGVRGGYDGRHHEQNHEQQDSWTHHLCPAHHCRVSNKNSTNPSLFCHTKYVYNG